MKMPVNTNNSNNQKDTKGWIGFVGQVQESTSPETNDFPVVLVREGDTVDGKRHYTKRAIRDVVKFVNSSPLKMYFNHTTDKEDRERQGVRNIRDWVSTAQYATEAVGVDGKLEARAMAHVHDGWLKENLKDPVFRENIGISIAAFAKFDGPQRSNTKRIVESIYRMRSGDWVPEGNAGGHVGELLESRNEDLEMLDSVTLEDLTESRPDLVEAIKEAQQKEGEDTDMKPEEIAAIAGKAAGEAVVEAMKPYQEKLDNVEKVIESLSSSTSTTKLEKLVEAEKLPVQAQGRVVEKLKGQNFESDDKLVEAVKEAANGEREYIKSFGASVSDNGNDEEKEKKTGLSTAEVKSAKMFGYI